MPQTQQKIIIDIQAKTNKATDEIKKLNKQISSLDKQVRKSNTGLKNSTSQINQMGASFKSLGQHLGRLLVIYGSFTAVADTVKTFANFEQAMVNLGAISGVTGDKLKELETKALELGESTVFSASQVVVAMTEMAKAGLSADEQLAGIDSVLNLAINGMIGLEEATLIATRAMNGFGLEATDLPQVVDVLSLAINSSATNITQLGNALAKVAPVAKEMNISMEETVSVLGILANAGRVGAEAGTQLKISLLRLGANVEVKKYLQDLSRDAGGLSTNMFDADGRAYGLIKRLSILRDATAGLTEELKSEHLTRIFGSEAITSAQIMLNKIEDIQIQTKLLNTSFGYADNNARKMMDTLQGSYKELISALEGLQLKIGKNLSPALRKIIDDATEFVRAIDPDAIQSFTDAIAGMINGLVEMDRYMSAFISTINSWRGELSSGAEELIIITALMYKFRASLQALFLLIKAHPVLAVLTTALTAVTIATTVWKKSIDDLNRSTDDYIKTHTGLSKSIEAVWTQTEKLTTQDARKYYAELGNGIEDANKLLLELHLELQALEKQTEDPFSYVSDAEKERIIQVKNQIKILDTTITDGLKTQAKVAEAGRKQIAIRNEEIKAMQKQGHTFKELGEQAQELSEKEAKSLQVTLKGYKTRQTSLESTLGTMSKRERALQKELVALDNQLAEVRFTHENKRKDFILEHQSTVKDANASLLSDLGQYNDAQLRADKELALAKKAIKDGDFAQAQTYYDEYLRLIKVNATEEIKQGDVVVQTKRAGVEEYVKDVKKGHVIGLELLAEQKRSEEQLIIDKAVQKEREIAIQQEQIKLQIKSIDIMEQMVKALSGIKFTDTFTEFKAEALKAEQDIANITSKQRTMKVTGELDTEPLTDALSTFSGIVAETVVTPVMKLDTDGIKDEYTLVVQELEGKLVTTKVRVDSTIAIESHKQMITDMEAKEITTKVDADVAPAEVKFTMWKKETQDTIVTPKLGLDKTPADAVNAQAEARYSQPIYRTMYIQEVIIPARQHGGIIFNTPQPKIQRFNKGGHALENGIGHSRKTGKLGGYGGGDKVKALLEAGEFIVKKDAVRKLGLKRMHMINQGNIPKFNQGGQAGQMPRYQVGGQVTKSNVSRSIDVNLKIGAKTFAVSADDGTANDLADYLQRNEF